MKCTIMDYKKAAISIAKIAVPTLALSLLFSPPSMAANNWTLGTGKGACYKNDNRKGGAKYCHNCKQQSGNQVKWTFDAMCNGTLAGHIEATLACGTSTPTEGEQLRLLQAKASALLPDKETECPE
ncbi:MAG: hypothetical protein L3J28_10765 [Candidatus Polarisedimenticolaceae bacterium]|nr:hypothetical protein [Candidatus Polarisedimenticolaceae bacterium]